jgi:hypothetical protein
MARAPNASLRARAGRETTERRAENPPVVRRRHGFALAMLAGVFALSAAAYTVLALRSPLPTLFPDEYRYAHLARGLADGTGFTWRGQEVGQSTALYVYFLTPFWALWRATPDAYAASKVAGAVALCLQVVPVWLLARTLVGARLAVAPAALSVAGTWMVASAFTATEVLAYPLTTAGLCTAVLGLQRRDRRLAALAIVFAGLAAWARIQMAVLVPVIMLAYALDVVRVPRPARRARLIVHGPILGVTGALTVAMLLVAVAAPGLAGDYATVFDYHAPLGQIVQRSALQLLELTVLAGFVPVLLAGMAAAAPSLWRDERVGPLLAVFWTAAIATAVQTGFYILGDAGDVTGDSATGIERYMAYAVPLSFVLMITLLVGPGLLTARRFLTAGALALTLLALPRAAQFGIEAALWSTAHRVRELTGAGSGLGAAALGVLLVGLAWAAHHRLRNCRGGAGLAVAAIVLAVLVAQAQPMWTGLLQQTRADRAQLPHDLQWLDHHGGGPVALLVVTGNSPQFAAVDQFNRSITQAFVPLGERQGPFLLGTTCSWQVDDDGMMTFARGCGAAPHRFFVDDPYGVVTFHDQTASVGDPRIGRVQTVAPGSRPRLRSLLVAPCPRGSETSGYVPCGSGLSLSTWLDAPGVVELRFRGGTQPHSVSLAPRTWRLAAEAVTTVRFGVPIGPSSAVLATDWPTSGGAPRLVAADLVTAGRRSSLLR